MFSAIDVAKWFILKNNSEMRKTEDDEYNVYEPITHLKLQKLLYYAQGIYLVLNRKPLFNEKILAWEHGPVVDEVYQKYKIFNKKPLTINTEFEDLEGIKEIVSSKKIVETLELTYENFAGYTAWQLRNMTHRRGSPWDKTRLNDIIDNDLIMKYFNDEIME